MMEIKIKSRIWIEKDGFVLMGEGRWNLLSAIDKYGSLSKASKSIGISYNKAWALLDSVRKSAGHDIIITSIGGKHGGGTKLTKYGKKLLSCFEEIKNDCWKYMDNQITKVKELEQS